MEAFTEEHRDGVVELLRRTLLTEDVTEADEIVGRLRRPIGAGHGLDGPGPVEPGVVGPAVTGTGGAKPGLVEVEHGRVIGVVLASIGHADPSAGHLDLIAVDPEHQRKGIGSALIATAEDELAALGCTVVRIAGNAPDYVWPGVDVRYTPAVCAVVASGYHHDQTAWNMTVDLTDPTSRALRSTAEAESRLIQVGIDIRTATSEDLTALLPVIDEEWGGAWVREVAAARGCHVALKEGQPVAFAAWGGARSSWFGPMGTLPAAEGLGIGSVLLRRCLHEQASTGITRAQIGWVGPVPFYSGAADAFIERVFFLYRKPLHT
ncbi:GNAT superfamily N-acetyltransferase [Allocatelliglobosispora scoriae]|uniref:GNAT superfamily N-acetyltransferase n=1 Tax=Allocatelliglobosispora scoriae TaxID=643052 RepID=A0A841BNJ2_9ACTN|nr:GNAT family N-acetyltransferase [Allocatelliglobosispora scoriae]MBB5870657.1 GNAT superfamily N-acetyltransferase [Allocatelliglobosispora scoriae]